MLRRLWNYPLNRWQARLWLLLVLVGEFFLFGMNLLAPVVTLLALIVIGGVIPYIQRRLGRPSN